MKKPTLMCLLVGCFLVFNAVKAQIISNGWDGRKWGFMQVDLTISTVNGEFVTLTESEDTFRDKRLDVVFIDPNGVRNRVPGFYAADFGTENTSANSGNFFKALFRPYMEGQWTCEGYYYEGTDVATMDVDELPEPTFAWGDIIQNLPILQDEISETDFRNKGRLQYKTTGSDSERRYLQFAETGEYFLKIGPDSPENLLNYEDFDFEDVFTNCGNNGKCFKHSYAPHAGDYVDGDPTWAGGKGKNIMGALNYIKDQGMNSISMSLFGGDDENIFPWVTKDNPYIYDVSKLAQWEVVFKHAQANGLLLHFKLAEAENWNALDENQLRLFYREMIARFGHHLAIEWNISEEYGGSDQTIPAESPVSRIDWLAALDPYHSPRVIHAHPVNDKKYNQWIDLNTKLTGASIQSPEIGQNSYSDTDRGFLTVVNNSKNSGTPWVVACDEQGPGFTGVFTELGVSNSEIQDGARQQYIWEQFIAGGAGVMWFGGRFGDFQTEDFRRFNTLFDWSKTAVDFFKDNEVAFWEMENRDDLVTGTLPKCLANPGEAYVIYLEEGGTTSLNLEEAVGTFDIKWFDPRNGGALQNGTLTQISGGAIQSIGNPPNTSSEDWVAYVALSNGDPIATGRAIPGRIEAEDFDSKVNLMVVDIEDEGQPGMGMGFSNNISELTYEVEVAQAGTYAVNIRVATPFGGRSMIVFADDVELTTIDVPNTGGWTSYQTLTSLVTFESAGTKILKLDYEGPSGPQYNLNWIEFTEDTTIPVTGQPIPGRIEAESYDSKVNLLVVDIEDEGQPGMGMGFSNNISELTYEVNVENPGEYTVGIRVATPFGGRSMVVFSNDVALGTIDVPNTGGWTSYQTITTQVTFETAGTQILKLDYEGPSGPQYNLNWIEFSETVVPSGQLIPGRIEAESYDSKVNLLVVDIEDEGQPGMGMGFSNNISELTYEVNVENPGEYTVGIRVATPFGGRSMIIFSNDVALGTINVPNTGGWTSYQTLTTQVIFDTAGTQILKLDYEGPSGPQYNLNWIEFSSVSAAKSFSEETTVISEQITLYPNPASDLVFIKSNGKQKISIVDMTGKVVLDTISLQENYQRIDISALKAGIYFVKSNTTTTKLVVKK